MAMKTLFRKLLVLGMLMSAWEGVFGGTAYVEGARTAAVLTDVMMTPDTKVVVDFASVTVRDGHGMMAERTATGWVLRKASGPMVIFR